MAADASATRAHARSRLPVWIDDLRSGGPRGLLSWQALTSSVGIFVATALTALYLVGPAGLSDKAAALTLAAAAVLCLVATPPAARVIKAVGPRRFAALSCFSRGLLFILLTLSTAQWWTVAVVLLIGLCEAAAFSVYQIIIATTLGEHVRNEAVAVRRTLGNIGFTVGGLITAAVVSLGGRSAYGAAFVGSGATLVVAAVILLRLPRSADGFPPDDVVEDGGERPQTGRAKALLDPRFVALIALAAAMATSLSLLTVGVPLWVIRDTSAPRALVGVLMVINTVLVVAFQVRLARRAETWSGARRAIVWGACALAIAAGRIAASAAVGRAGAVALLVTAAVVAAAAEMLDSAGWWTISYGYARPAHRTDYLAAFDVVTPTVSVIGPPLMIAVVAAGSGGWLAYGGVFVVVAAAAAWLLRTTPAHLDPSA